MGTSAQPQAAEGTTAGQAVATTTEEQAAEKESKTALAIGTLPKEIKDALILRRQQALVTAEIAGTNWGKGLDAQTRMRVSQWAQSAGIDPATELDVLGGRFYKNAQYYIRRLSEMLNAGIVEYAYVDHVEVDERLVTMAARADNAELAQTAQREIDRRTMMRIQYQIPDEAKGASVFHVKLKAVPQEFSAAKWCGGGTRKSDPVGDSFPVETSETRAARRCLRFIASHDPNFRPFIEKHDDDQIDQDIGGELRDGLLRAKEELQRAVEFSRPKPMMQIAAANDPYGTGTPTATPERVPVQAEVKAPPAEKKEPAPDAIRQENREETRADRPEATEEVDRSDELELLDPEERARVAERLKTGKAPF